eukprot:76103_1
MTIYSYYDYLVTYYHDYYDYYYDYYYWPVYYGIYNVSNDSWCDPNTTYHYNMSSSTTTSPLNYTDTTTAFPFQSTIVSQDFNCTPRYNGTFPPHGYPYEQWWHEGMHVIGPVVTIATFVFATLSLVIAVLFFRQLSIALKKKTRSRPDKLTVFLSSLCMISHVSYNLADMPAYYYWYFDYDRDKCLLSEIAWEFCWCLAKVTIYGLYAYRYYILQRASIHDRVSKNARNIRFGLIGFCICVQIALEVVLSYNYYNWSTIGYDDPDYAQRQRTYLNFAWSVMGIDFVLVLFLGYLIMRTILQLVIAINDPSRKGMSSKTQEMTSRSGQSELSNSPVQSMGSASTPGDDTAPAKRFRVWSISLRSTSGVTSEERRKKRSSRQMNLIEVTTRIALTCMVSLLSSLLMQFMWIVMEETENYHLLFFSYFWGLDGTVNMLCVYFSMAFAKEHYMKVCGDCLRCHHCCLWCVMRLVGLKTDDKEMKDLELERQKSGDKSGTSGGNGTTDGTGHEPIDLSDVAPSIPPLQSAVSDAEIVPSVPPLQSAISDAEIVISDSEIPTVDMNHDADEEVP